MIAFESMHYLKRKTQGKKGFVALKNDMSKAYDRIEWEFTKNMMMAMGFCSKWVDLIMLCVTTVQYIITQDSHKIGLFFLLAEV